MENIKETLPINLNEMFSFILYNLIIFLNSFFTTLNWKLILKAYFGII